MNERKLSREIGTFSAIMIGLGSIIGAGAFVSMGLGAGIAGTYMLISIFIAFLLALCNGISSAQLASNHPVSGGTYAYGRKYINNYFGFIAGWMFIFAKSASAATAALGFGGYITSQLGLQIPNLHIFIALILVLVITSILLIGITKTLSVNNFIVIAVLLTLIFFIVLGFTTLFRGVDYSENVTFDLILGNEEKINSILYATAIMFVAYTGYGRIATMGEEIKNPRKSIPKVIFICLGTTFVLYFLIALISINIIGTNQFYMSSVDQLGPLRFVAERFFLPDLGLVLTFGALLAMIGVLLNLILGISRVIFAMGRNRDLPYFFSRVSGGNTPYLSIILTGFIICIIVLTGDIKLSWSFSAFSVLLYYGITNLAAIRLSKKDMFFPKWISLIGLIFCITIALYIEKPVIYKGILLIFAGSVFYILVKYIRKNPA